MAREPGARHDVSVHGHRDPPAVEAESPQERLDRALSYFTRTFRHDPSGHAFALWRRIYKAIGDPPIGTTIAVRVDILTPEECETIGQALCELQAEIQKTCWEAERTATLAAEASQNT